MKKTTLILIGIILFIYIFSGCQYKGKYLLLTYEADVADTGGAMTSCMKIMKERYLAQGYNILEMRLVGIRRVFIEIAFTQNVDKDALIEFAKTAGNSEMVQIITESGDVVFDANDFQDALKNEGSVDTRDYVIVNFTYEGIKKAKETSDDYIGKELSFYIGDELITTLTILHSIREDYMIIDSDFTFSQALEITDRINNSILMPFTMNYISCEEYDSR